MYGNPDKEWSRDQAIYTEKEDLLAEWMDDAGKIGHFMSYFQDQDWKCMEEKIAQSNADGLMNFMRDRIRDYMEPEAVALAIKWIDKPQKD